MSDVPASVVDTATVVQTVSESSGPVWPYVVGVIIALVIVGFAIYKYVNRPTLMINLVRKRNLKAMQKEGVEGNEATEDINKLLDSLERYATAKKMSGSKALKFLAPLNETSSMKSPRDMYLTMQKIAKDINDTDLANNFGTKATGVKAQSKLMNSLFKRAGI